VRVGDAYESLRAVLATGLALAPQTRPPWATCPPQGARLPPSLTRVSYESDAPRSCGDLRGQRRLLLQVRRGAEDC
jgi:hypothetical protein